jgi:hypothetical protein
LRTAGGQTLTATDTVNSSIIGTSSAVAVAQAPNPTPAPASLLLTLCGLAFVGVYLARRKLAGRMWE